MTDTATIGHNSAAVGEILAGNPKLVFTEQGMMESLIDKVKSEVAALTPDISTENGRGAIRSLAHSIAKRKVRFDEAGKELNEDHRKAINAVDEKRRKLKGDLEAIQKECRKPLTEWEEAEEDRKSTINNIRGLFAGAATASGEIGDIELYLDRVVDAGNNISSDIFGELESSVRSEQAAAIAALEATIDRLKQEAADKAELERLRAEKAETERAAAEAEAKRYAEAEAQKRIDDAAKAAADKAAEDERRSAQAAIDAANKAAADAQAELDRQAKEKADAERQEAAREADKKHRSKIMGETKIGLMEHGGVDEDAAKTIVLAIIAGSIPNVRLSF